MDLSNAAFNPSERQGYIPYFYQRGLHHVYDISEQHRTRSDHYGGSATYDFTSDLIRSPRSERPLNVEQIIHQGYLATPNTEPTFALLEDRSFTTGLGLDDVITQIRRRHAIHDQMLYRIDASICASINAIYQHECYCGPGSASSKQHYAKHKAIQELYAEKRLEEIALWKDVSRLRTLLPENAQSYLAAHRKLAIVRSDPGDSP